MKKIKFSIVFAAVLAIFSLVFCACPALEEDSYGFILKYEGPLDMYKWFKILDEVAADGRYVTLDLKDCTYVEDNQFAGLIKVEIDDGTLLIAEEYIAFDTFPAIRFGKDRIKSIILPDAAQMVNMGVEIPETDDEDEDEEDEEEKDKFDANFRHFVNLRSVSGANVSRIGNYAFINCTSIKEINFPRVGHTVSDAELTDPNNEMINGFRIDIGHFAFKGCTGLTEVKFNSAAVIGRSAFKGCANLSKVNFPVVWMIAQNAFEGCKNLTEIRFESATKIGNEAFKDCTKLKKAYFDANPTSSAGDPIPGGVPVYNSVIFYDAAFSGCKSLQMLDIRPAWNVFFCIDVLENTGKTIDIYLHDASSGEGHPQVSEFLGSGDKVTLEEINIYVPMSPSSSNVESGIKSFIVDNYPDVEVAIRQTSI